MMVPGSWDGRVTADEFGESDRAGAAGESGGGGVLSEVLAHAASAIVKMTARAARAERLPITRDSGDSRDSLICDSLTCDSLTCDSMTLRSWPMRRRRFRPPNAM